MRAAIMWGARGVLALLLLGRLAAPTPQAAVGPPTTVQTTLPQLCVHTRLMDEVEAWKIQQSLVLAREMGATAIVEFFPWAYVEGQRGRDDWASTDRVMALARAQGLRVIARLGFVPAWAQENEASATLNTLPPSAYADFARYAAAFAARYVGTADHVIVWNEPNLAFEWGYQAVDPAGYVALLEASAHAIRAASPSTQVLLAGLAPTLERSPNALDDLAYLEAVYAAGGAAHFDGVAVHTYGFTHPPSDPPAPDALNFRRAELLHDVMLRHGDGGKPVFITETGWNDDPHWAQAVSPAQRAQHTLDALALARDWPWAHLVCLWVLRAPARTYTVQDGFTMITPNFQPRAVFRAVQAYARGWDDDTALWLPAP